MKKTNKNWRQAMWAWYDENRKTPFSRDKNDCIRQTNSLVKLMTETNLFPAKMMRYKTDKQALKVLKNLGGMEKALEKIFSDRGLFAIPVSKRTTGDLVFFKSPRFGGVSVVIGGTCFSPTENGLEAISRQSECKAWRIPNGY